jgi:hypothetical protein
MQKEQKMETYGIEQGKKGIPHPYFESLEANVNTLYTSQWPYSGLLVLRIQKIYLKYIGKVHVVYAFVVVACA